MSRKAIPKSVRFEVFKRDSFTCQYCGSKAPDVVLHIDHINPVAEGGDNDILNLVTSCVECNMGKSSKQLSDHSVVDKKHKALSELQERKNQIEMMFEWQSSLSELEDFQLDKLVEYFEERVWDIAKISDKGRESLRVDVKKYGIEFVMSCIDKSIDYYFKGDYDSAAVSFNKIPGICRSEKSREKDPDKPRLYYIRGIMRNRFHYCDDRKAIMMLTAARKSGVDVDDMEELAKEARNWAEFRDALDEMVSYLTRGDDA